MLVKVFVCIFLINEVNFSIVYCQTIKQFEIINGLVSAAETDRPVDTIVYFGRSDVIAPYLSSIKPEIPKVLVTQYFGDWHFRNEAGFSSNILFIAFGLFEESARWYQLKESFVYMQNRIRGIFVTPNRKDNFYEHFTWCWRNGYADVIALVQRDESFEAYCYSPFPNLQVFAVPLREPKNVDCFANNFHDLRGYKMRTAVQYDPPRIFRVPFKKHDYESGWEIKGYTGVMFQEFLKRHNGILHIVRNHNDRDLNILGVIKELNRGNIDMSMNPYLAYPGVRISYPLRMMHWCILVPSSQELQTYEYFIRPYKLSLWLGCVVLLFYFATIRSLCAYVLKIRLHGRARFAFTKHLIEIFRLMIYQSTPPHRGHIHWTYVFLFICIITLGFILTNYYLALLTSFLTKVIFEPEIDSLDEIVKRNVSMNVMAHELPIILENRGLPKGFTELLIPRNATYMIKDIIALNKVAAFTAREDLIQFALVQQDHQLRPRFHIAKEYIVTVPVGYLMPSHSQFKKILNHFILYASAAGLIDKWFQDTIYDGFHSGILYLRKDHIEYAAPLTLHHFQFAWILLLCGALMAALVFLTEILLSFKYHLSFSISRYK